MTAPERLARHNFDGLLKAIGWHVCDNKHANIYASRCVALLELRARRGGLQFMLRSGQSPEPSIGVR